MWCIEVNNKWTIKDTYLAMRLRNNQAEVWLAHAQILNQLPAWVVQQRTGNGRAVVIWGLDIMWQNAGMAYHYRHYSRIYLKSHNKPQTADQVSNWDFKNGNIQNFSKMFYKMIMMKITMILSILFNVCYNENTLSSFSGRFELARYVHWELLNNSLSTSHTIYCCST